MTILTCINSAWILYLIILKRDETASSNTTSKRNNRLVPDKHRAVVGKWARFSFWLSNTNNPKQYKQTFHNNDEQGEQQFLKDAPWALQHKEVTLDWIRTLSPSLSEWAIWNYSMKLRHRVVKVALLQPPRRWLRCREPLTPQASLCLVPPLYDASCGGNVQNGMSQRGQYPAVRKCNSAQTGKGRKMPLLPVNHSIPRQETNILGLTAQPTIQAVLLPNWRHVSFVDSKSFSITTLPLKHSLE